MEFNAEKIQEIENKCSELSKKLSFQIAEDCHKSEIPLELIPRILFATIECAIVSSCGVLLEDRGEAVFKVFSKDTTEQFNILAKNVNTQLNNIFNEFKKGR